MHKNLIETGKVRATVYQLFSALFCQPEEDVIGNDEAFQVLALSLSKLESPLVKDVQNLIDKKGNYSPEELLIEYSRLFLGPFKTLAPPYSSVYLGSQRTVFGEETLMVMDYYRRSGLQATKEGGEVPDHIVIELEFIYYLIYRQVMELEDDNTDKFLEYNRIETEFKSQHLNRWFPAFCDRIINQTRNEYYKCLALILMHFIMEDYPLKFK